MDAILSTFDVWALLTMVMPVLVGAISVPLFGLAKKLVAMIDRLPAWSQQVLVVVQTWVLGSLSGLADVALSDTLASLTLDQTESLIAAAVAFAIHAGKKASGSDS